MRPDSPLGHAKHIIRAALLLVAAIVVLVLGRSFFVPDTWGQYGGYRGEDAFEQRIKQPEHGGNESCDTCHPDELEEISEGVHRTLACESCHAPLSLHVANDDKIADMPIRRALGLCLNCHRELEARPDGFPQVNPRQHVRENEAEYHDQVCLECHEAHSPL